MKSLKNDKKWPPEGRENLPSRFWNTALYPTAEDAYNAFYDSPEFKAMAAEADKDTLQNPPGPKPVKQQLGPSPIKMPAATAEFDTTRFLQGLAGVESDLRWDAENPTSSAVGAHQFLWNLIKDDPTVGGMTKSEYLNSPDTQMLMAKKALSKPVAGGNPYDVDVQSLKDEYRSQIPGFDNMFSDMDLYLMRHKMGKQGAREYLGYTIRDKQPENVKGVNMTFPQYQEKFYSYYND